MHRRIVPAELLVSIAGSNISIGSEKYFARGSRISSGTPARSIAASKPIPSFSRRNSMIATYRERYWLIRLDESAQLPEDWIQLDSAGLDFALLDRRKQRHEGRTESLDAVPTNPGRMERRH